MLSAVIFCPIAAGAENDEARLAIKTAYSFLLSHGLINFGAVWPSAQPELAGKVGSQGVCSSRNVNTKLAEENVLQVHMTEHLPGRML